MVLPGPRRVVLHAGFHKTGTTTVQTFLRWNARKLAPDLITAQNADLRDFIQATRSYSMWCDPIAEGQITHRLAAFLDGIKWGDRRTLLISVEEMSGLLPGLPQKRGRPQVETYAAAPDLIRIIARGLRTSLGADTDVAAIYGTRSPQSWLRSVYWQHVKVQRMVLDEGEFMIRYAAAADLDGVVDQVAAINPQVTVARFRLEDTAMCPFGPVGPVLERAGIAADVLADCRIPAPVNTAPPADVLDEMLRLNRSDLPNDALRNRKKALEATVQSTRSL